MRDMKIVQTLFAFGLLAILLTMNLASAEITPPSDDVDPKTETPTNEGLNMKITSVSMDVSATETTYDYSFQVEGTASDDVVQGYYCIWAYYPQSTFAQQSWEASPIDEDHTYGGHGYKEEFFGTGPEGSWSTWKWTFQSSGPIDENNENKFDDPESYWGPIEEMVLYVRGYAEDGTWDQDSRDVTEEYTGLTSSSADDDDTDDDDTDDDDTDDDDTSDDDTDDDDDGDDSPGFEVSLILAAILVASVIIIRRKRN